MFVSKRLLQTEPLNVARAGFLVSAGLQGVQAKRIVGTANSSSWVTENVSVEDWSFLTVHEC